MKLAILNITGGGLSGGYRKYLSKMLPKLASNENLSDLIVSLPSNEYQVEYSKNFCNINLFTYVANHHLKKKLDEFKPDVIFIPTSRYIRFGTIPVVNMVRNMEPMVSIPGNPIAEILINNIKKYITKKSVLKANRVIAISEHVKQYLEDWGINADSMATIYHGVNVERNSVPSKPNIIPEDWARDFLFTAGSIRPARGLEDLLKAMKNLELEVPKVVKLIIAGKSGHQMVKYNKKLIDWIESNNLSSRILWVGDLNDEEMSWCYQNCSVFVMTSRVEACPNTALESMSYGSLCVSTTAPPMPEIFGEAAIYYNAGNSQSLAEVINTVLTWDNKTKNFMYDKAIKRAEIFSWDICVERTVIELAKAAGKLD